MARRAWAALGATALAAVLAATTGAKAADMALRGSLPAYEASGPNWGGFYIGGFGGFASTNLNAESAGKKYVDRVLQGVAFVDGTAQNTAIGNVTRLDGIHRSSTSFGAFLGYQAQFEDAVVGFEIDYTRVNAGGTSSAAYGSSLYFSGSHPGIIFVPDPTTGAPVQTTVTHTFRDVVTPATTVSAQLSDYWSARVRGGWAFGRLMPYLTAGVVLARGSASMSYGSTCSRVYDMPTPLVPQSCVGARSTTAVSQSNKLAYGFTAGLGIEAMITDNIFARAEYQYVTIPSLAGVPVSLQTVRAGVGIRY